MSIRIFIILYLLSSVMTSVFANPWSNPVVIRNSGRQPCLAVDQNDHLYLVFKDQVNNDSIGTDIFFMSFDGESWINLINLSNTKKYSINPRMIIENNNKHVFWEDVCRRSKNKCPPEVFYSYYHDENWTGPINIYHSVDTTFSLALSGPAINTNKQCYIMWEQDLWIKYIVIEDGKPSEINTVRRGFIAPNICVDSKDNIHVVCMGLVKKKSIKRRRNGIFYFYYSQSESTWSEPVLVYYDKNYYSQSPRIITDNNGRIHIIWLQDEDSDIFPNAIYHSYSDDGIHWKKAYDISHTGGNCFTFSMVLDSRNRLHIVWPQAVSNSMKMDHIWYAVFNRKSWSKPHRITPEGENMGTSPTIAVDNKDNLHVIWVGRLFEVGENKVLYSTTRQSKIPVK